MKLCQMFHFYVCIVLHSWVKNLLSQRNLAKLSKKKRMHYRGQNNDQPSDMTKRICHLINLKFSQVKALSRKEKIIEFVFRFQGNLQRSRNNEPKRCLFTTEYN